ncbi:MAG: aminoacyl-tRNA hydrolase, partial [Deltaproteobacteria bacterium]|nr:aminoacyl-tRNA hydrolase [Deltaproteobacteria bacterium]
MHAGAEAHTGHRPRAEEADRDRGSRSRYRRSSVRRRRSCQARELNAARAVSTHLIAGLGNPGPKYANNRHNVGFMVVDELRRRWGASAFRDKFKGEFTKVRVGSDEVVLLKPLTYMNLSGESVQAAMRFFKVPLEQVVCVHDELDLEFGVVRLKVGGGTAGHNGLRSMVQHCGGPGFVRCRVGIGRPRH